MSRRRTSPRFRHQVASCLKAAIRKHHLTKSEAAELLGVRRQTLWLYLKEKSAPGPEVLRRASKLWRLSLYEGYVLSSEAFGSERKPQVQPRQLNLFKAFEEIRPNQIKTELIGRVGEYFELRVRIKVAS